MTASPRIRLTMPTGIVYLPFVGHLSQAHSTDLDRTVTTLGPPQLLHTSTYFMLFCRQG